ncbi:thiamine pyrophosphate-dependent dehydrogenase E1 component subunit alpha [Methylocapsa palsarum]|uniref:Pyruvate dehydrogenase E1 component alpha subunit n=1 Tax=Methylocapsa palsarum TaxID=1612308 RepID=A0A1I3YVF8_9HYPH|nr:thiamine pyrophosphate-dependent dehydrogenase E1 component subunit alpha [Methylocapsa palsarum]SFK35349.1 pyruvate dehydrogenase E1 component alpha subunit [Methylocapsa palsarum]
MDRVLLLRSMMLIRAFEAALLRNPGHGFQLLSSGEEAVAVGLCAALTADDQLLTSGRSIGPALARGLDPGRVLAELLGKSAGPCQGKGGRGHIAEPSAGFFGAHAVVGGNLTIAAGVALALQSLGSKAIVACLFGDGACGGGALHETLNIAALWKLPLVLVCDNNRYSVSTPRAAALAPEYLSDIAKPFGVPGQTVDGMDVMAVLEAARGFVELARSGGGPSFLECVSFRFSSHSTATRDTRTPAELDAARSHCPIELMAGRLAAEGLLAPDVRAELEHDVAEAVSAAASFAEASPFPDPSEALSDVA